MNVSRYLTTPAGAIIGAAGLTVLAGLVAPQFAGDRPPVAVIEDHDPIHAQARPLLEPTFVDATLQMGLFHEHRQEASSHGLVDLVDVAGAGVCIGDIDGDHLDDLVFTTGSGPTRDYGKPSWWLRHSGIVAYVNRLSHFEDRTAPLGLDLDDATMGCLLSDLDADGRNDLVVTSVGGLRLFYNDGGERFVEADGFAEGIERWTMGVTARDVNTDQLPDLLVTGYLNYDRNQITAEPGSGFAAEENRRFDPNLYDGTTNLLFVNQGDRTFVESSGVYFPANDLDRSLGALWLDADTDGDDDLLVLNDGSSHSRLYLRGDEGLFVEPSSLHEPFRLLSASHAHLDADGSVLITRQLGLGHVLLRRADDGMLHDRSWSAGVNSTRSVNFSAWGAAGADFNLDGQQDYFLAAGMRSRDSYAVNRALAQPNTLLLGDGADFRHVDGIGSVRAAGSSRSVGTTDLNLDGRPDLVIANNNAPPQLLINTTVADQPWIAIRHAGIGSAEVSLQQDRWARQARIGSRPLFLGSQNGFTVVTLGADRQVDVTVRHHGQVSRHTLEPNRHYAYRQGVITALPRRGVPAPVIPEPAGPVPDFLREARILARITQPARIAPDEVDQIRRLLQQAGPELRLRLLREPPRLELLPIYLSLLEASDHALALAALDNVRVLESDLSTDYLLPRLTDADDPLICPLALLFRDWYREEEAATKSKLLAVPYLIRLLDHDRPDILACAADALAEAEHLTAVPGLMAAYHRTGDVHARMALAHALGAIRQRGSREFLLQSFAQSRDPGLQVAIAIALNRLAPGLGDDQMQARLADADPLPRAELAARLLQPEQRVHFLPATIDTAVGPAGVLNRIQWADLTADARLVLSDLLERAADSDALVYGLESARPFLRSAATRILNRLTAVQPDTALAIFRSPAWQALSVDIQRQVLAALPAGRLLAAVESGPLWAHALDSVDLMSSKQALVLLDGLEAGIPPVDARHCRAAPVSVEPGHVRALASRPDLKPLTAALIAPVVARDLPALGLRAWLSTTLRSAGSDAAGLLDCLAGIRTSPAIRRELNLALLGLPETLDPLEQHWLLVANPDDPLVANGIASRLRQQDAAFAHRYLLRTPAAAVNAAHLELLAAFPPGSAPHGFAEAMRAPMSIGQVQHR